MRHIHLKSLQGSRRELTDSIYLMLLQGVNQLLPVVVMPYLMIHLGASGYGYVGFALSVIQYLMLVVDFGFNLSATKRIAQVMDDKDRRSEVFWNVVAARVLLLVASTLLLAVLVSTVPTFRIYSHTIWATWPMVLGSTFTFMWYFQGVGRVRMFSVMNTLSKLLLLPLIFVFVKEPADCMLAAFLQALVFVSTALISNVYLIAKRMVKWHKPTWTGVKEELRVSFPLFLSTASTSVYTQLIVIVLGFYCTSEVVGQYASADRIMRAVCFLFYVPISQVFFPKISSMAQTNRMEATRLVGQVRSLVVFVMAMLGVGLFLGGNLLPSLLGEDYAGINVYLQIFSIVPLAIGIGGIYGQMGLVALGNEYTSKKFRNVYFQAALVSVTLMFVLTPWLKASGACITVALTEVSVAVLMMLNCKKYLNLCF